jgi:hypothetical protein
MAVEPVVSVFVLEFARWNTECYEISVTSKIQLYRTLNYRKEKKNLGHLDPCLWPQVNICLIIFLSRMV